MRITYYIFFFVSITVFSQNIQGILYDSEGVVTNFEIWNKTQRLLVKTDGGGYFQLEAKMGDSIIFNSVTYEKYFLLASQKHFNEQIVVELKTNINELNEVNLTGYKKEFDVKKYNKEFKIKIKNDREKHPYLYKKVPSPQGNLLSLFSILYQQIFKKKRSEEIVEIITFNDFKNLFETDSYINEEFLNEELQIPSELKNLYFDYLDSLFWNAELLTQENRLNLIQKLYDSSSDYSKILESNDVLK